MEMGWWMLKDAAIIAAVAVALFFIFRIIFYRASKNRLATGRNPARIRAIFLMLIIYWLVFAFILFAFGGFRLSSVGFLLISLLLIILIIITPDKFIYYPVAILAVADIGGTLVAVFEGYYNLLDLVLAVVRLVLLLTAMLLNYKVMTKGSSRSWSSSKTNIMRSVSALLAVVILIIIIIDAFILD